MGEEAGTLLRTGNGEAWVAGIWAVVVLAEVTTGRRRGKRERKGRRVRVGCGLRSISLGMVEAGQVGLEGGGRVGTAGRNWFRTR